MTEEIKQNLGSIINYDIYEILYEWIEHLSTKFEQSQWSILNENNVSTCKT